MAAKLINDINEKVLLCSICHERFDSPKTLNCQHSFCLKCIEGWVNKNSGVLSCPMCRREFDIPEKGLTELPSSYFINQLLEYTADIEGRKPDDSSCVVCKSKTTAHCMECSSYLCNQCAGNHCNIPACRSHTVMPLEKYKSMDAKERASAKPVMCPKHNDVAVEFYCAGCSLPVCIKCTVVGHKGHDLQELDTAFEVFKTNAKETLADCSGKADEINAELKKHSEDTEKQKQSVNKCKEEVTCYTKKLRQLIDEAEKRILDDLTQRSESLSQSREKERVVKQDKLKQIQNVSMFIESLSNAPQPTAALFDANKSITEAANLIDKQLKIVHSLPATDYSEHDEPVIPEPEWYEDLPVSTLQQVLKDNIEDTPAMSFHFHENKQLVQSALSIGCIQSQNLNYQPLDQPDIYEVNETHETYMYLDDYENW